MLEADLHVHSSFTYDAFNTPYEMAAEASRKGIKMIGICDHGPVDAVTPSMQDHFTMAHFHSPRRKRTKIDGIELIWGIEIDILDEDGTLDPGVSPEILMRQDLVIASLHNIKDLKVGVMRKAPNPARAIITVMRNPLIDIIGHPYLLASKEEIKEIVDAAVKQNIPLELNNSCFIPPRDFKKYQDLAIFMAKLLKEKGGRISVGSDARIAWELGGDEGIKAVLKEAKFDTKNIVNWTLKQANEFLAHRRRDA